MIRKIFFAGNNLEKTDTMAIKLVPYLKKLFPEIIFTHFDPTEEVDEDDKELVIIDTVINIHQVALFRNLEAFSLSSRNSVHDYDLILDLNLLLKLKKINKVTIIGVPAKGKAAQRADEVRRILSSILLSGNGRRSSYRDRKS